MEPPHTTPGPGSQELVLPLPGRNWSSNLEKEVLRTVNEGHESHHPY